jgi:hypothetical protein
MLKSDSDSMKAGNPKFKSARLKDFYLLELRVVLFGSTRSVIDSLRGRGLC